MDLSNLEGFDWDQGNLEKNKIKHQVSKIECEQVFANQPLVIFPDLAHSQHEDRFGALGITNQGRRLAIFFVIRKRRIRIISARSQNSKDKAAFEIILERTSKWGKSGER